MDTDRYRRQEARDHAQAENGAYWENLNFPAFPATLPAAAVVAVIQVPWHANNRDHSFAVELVDSDGRPFPNFEISGTFRGSAAPDMKFGDAGTMMLAIPPVRLAVRPDRRLLLPAQSGHHRVGEVLGARAASGVRWGHGVAQLPARSAPASD